MSPDCGGAVSSVSAGTVADAEGAAVGVAGALDAALAGAAGETAGWLVPPDCGVGGVQAVRASSSASSPAPALRAVACTHSVPVVIAPILSSPRPCQPRNR